MLSKIGARAGLLVAVAVVVQGGLLALAAQEAAIKIAVVDLERVFVLSNAGKELQGKLERFQQQVQAEGERMTAEANAIRRRATEGAQALTEEKLAELQKEYEDKAVEIRRFRDDKQREGEKIKNEGLREIEMKLEPVFKRIRDERGYDLILNNVPGIVVMAGDRLDITDEIVRRLNAATGGG